MKELRKARLHVIFVLDLYKKYDLTRQDVFLISSTLSETKSTLKKSGFEEFFPGSNVKKRNMKNVLRNSGQKLPNLLT